MPVYGAEILYRYLDGGSDERGHRRHDRIGKERADLDRLTTLDLNRTEWFRCESNAASGNRQHDESEYRALSDEKQVTHCQLLSCKSVNVVL